MYQKSKRHFILANPNGGSNYDYEQVKVTSPCELYSMMSYVPEVSVTSESDLDEGAVRAEAAESTPASYCSERIGRISNLTISQ